MAGFISDTRTTTVSLYNDYLFSCYKRSILISIMRPNTRHKVLTLQHSVAFGAHFYSRIHFSRTLTAMTNEHYFGTFITNAAHLSTASILFKLMKKYATETKNGKNDCKC